MNSRIRQVTFLVFVPSRLDLIINGILGPLLLGGAVATFFTGSNFIVEKGNITDFMQPVISHWANGSRGLDVLLNPWVVIFWYFCSIPCTYPRHTLLLIIM